MAIPRPSNISTPFADDATSLYINDIPVAPPSDPQAACWEKGFPPITMTPKASSGLPPYGQDMNGVLNRISEHTRFTNAGGQYRFDAALSTILGGYDQGTVLQSNDGLSAYVSAINNNTINFNTSPSSIGNQWLPWSGQSFSSAGQGSFIKTSNIAPELVAYSASGGAGSSAINYPIQTVFAISPPAGAKIILVNAGFFINTGGNTATRLYVRKNSSEAWTSKILLDPIQTPTGLWEVQDSLMFPIVMDTTSNSFQFYVAYNYTSQSSSISHSINLWLNQEGFYL